MIIKESQLRKIIRKILIESDETVSMDPSIFKMMAPASLVNKEKSKPRIVSPRPVKFDYTSLANLIIMLLEKDRQVLSKNIDIRNEKFLSELMEKISSELQKREEDVKKISIS